MATSAFGSTLKQIVEGCADALSVILMDFDGIALESEVARRNDVDIETVTAELSATLAQIRRAADILQVGALEEVAIRSERLTFVVRVLNENYFVGLAMGAEGSLGKGRYLLRRFAPQIRTLL
jgi:predicted regulator of Ras-like GTPase activity (Roadblock/LC7/MglB family)